ncbi:MAG TPA: hypothetical protein IAA30_02795 [Candidatus Treponema faecavium]|nr:hypothetical protein [Candidatus Treponema faecavium]
MNRYAYTEIKNFAVIAGISLFFTAILAGALLFLYAQTKNSRTFAERIELLPQEIIPCGFTITDKQDLLLTIRIDFYNRAHQTAASRTVILQGQELFFTFAELSVQGTDRRLIFPVSLYSDLIPETNAIPLYGAYTGVSGEPVIYTGFPFSDQASKSTLRDLFASVQSGANQFCTSGTIGVRNLTEAVRYNWVYNMETHTIGLQ